MSATNKASGVAEYGEDGLRSYRKGWKSFIVEVVDDFKEPENSIKIGCIEDAERYVLDTAVARRSVKQYIETLGCLEKDDPKVVQLRDEIISYEWDVLRYIKVLHVLLKLSGKSAAMSDIESGAPHPVDEGSIESSHASAEDDGITDDELEKDIVALFSESNLTRDDFVRFVRDSVEGLCDPTEANRLRYVEGYVLSEEERRSIRECANEYGLEDVSRDQVDRVKKISDGMLEVMGKRH